MNLAIIGFCIDGIDNEKSETVPHQDNNEFFLSYRHIE